MKKSGWIRWLAACLAVVLLIGTVAATLNFDLNGDGKTNVWDLQLAINQGKTADEQKAALDEVLGGGDELHKNADGNWEIWSALGLYNMAKNAESGDTFVLMQDIDLDGATWAPVENFNGKFLGGMFTISNMKITQDIDGNMGFFGNIAEGGLVEYLNVSDMNFIASERSVNIGLLAGTCAGTIDGCTAIGFITDARIELPGNVYVGGLVGKMLPGGSIISRDTNKLPEVGAEQAINTISAQIGTRFADESGHIVGIVGDGVELVDAGTVLQDLTGTMPDPNAIAWVKNGNVTTYPLTLTELLAGINADGNTVVTLQADITNGAAVKLPYSCTFDCNGYTVRTPETKNNGFEVDAAGSDNKTFTLKNGKLYHHTIGVCVKAGAVVVSNMTIVSYAGAPVGLYGTTDYTAINKIENCTLVSKAWGCVVFNGKDQDMTKNGITISNSDLISGKPEGNPLLIKNLASKAGTVTLGDNVNLYTYATNFSTTAVTLAGIDPVKMEDVQTVTVGDLTYEGLNRWTTNAELINAEVIAEVTNGTETVQVTNADDMVAQIKSDGSSKIKLMKDIVRTSPINIPYSCTIDLAGYSITNSVGNTIVLNGVGTKNTVTKISNGRLNHAIIGIRVNKGSVELSNVEVFGTGACGASVGFYDPTGAYRAGNKINGCTLYNPNYVNIMYYGTDVDFHETGVTISNTTMIASKTYPFAVTTDRMSGICELGANVDIYSPRSAMNNGSLYRFEGKLAYRDDKTSVTVNGTTINGMKHWSTEVNKDMINILLIGNSYSTTIPQELYNIATNAGYEVNVANLYFPGCIAAEHWDWLNNDVANYQYRHQSEMGNYIRRGDMSTSRNALEDLEWDVIVYQDWFTPYNVVRDSGYVCDSSTLEKLYANHQEPAYNMMQYLKTNYPNAKHYYYQHWSWQVGHSAIPDMAAANAMWDRINTASTKFAEDNDFILIPCGLAFQLARADESIGETLWDTDKGHDGAAGGGQYLNGCVFFETIFQESCIGDNWRASNGPSEEKHVLLQQYAHEAVATVHGEDWAKE